MKTLFPGLLLLGFCSAAFSVEVVDGFICTDEKLSSIPQEPAQGMMYEVARINDAFDRCTRTRARDKSENYLYTWGYKPKLQRMLSTERFEFCGYDQARLQTVIAVYLDQTQKSQRDDLMDEYLTQITRDYFSIPSESYYPIIRGKIPAELTKLFAQQLRDCEGSLRCRAQVEGRLAGLDHFHYIKENKKHWNTATNGHGVYFGNDPLTFLEHKASDDDIGLVCDLSSTNLKITDLSHKATETALENRKIRIPADLDLIPKEIRKRAVTARGVYPYYNLPAYEMAGHKRILRFHNRGNIYLDKCAIEYRASCKIISVDNLNSCRVIKQVHKAMDDLLNNPQTITDKTQKQKFTTLGYYLIQQGGYRNTEHLIEALDERRKLRCPKKKIKRKKKKAPAQAN